MPLVRLQIVIVVFPDHTHYFSVYLDIFTSERVRYFHKLMITS